MKKIIFLLSALISTLLIYGAPPSHRCPLCSGTMIWTGDTKTEWGKLVYKMRCPSNHVSWEVDNSRNSSSSETQTSSTSNYGVINNNRNSSYGSSNNSKNSSYGNNRSSSNSTQNSYSRENVKCQYDSFSMYFTGETKTEFGKLLYKYKCAGGHIVWKVK